MIPFKSFTALDEEFLDIEWIKYIFAAVKRKKFMNSKKKGKMTQD